MFTIHDWRRTKVMAALRKYRETIPDQNLRIKETMQVVVAGLAGRLLTNEEELNLRRELHVLDCEIGDEIVGAKKAQDLRQIQRNIDYVRRKYNLPDPAMPPIPEYEEDEISPNMIVFAGSCVVLLIAYTIRFASRDR